MPKNAQLPAEKAALHQLGEEGLDQIEIESLLEVAMWQIAVAQVMLQNGVGWIMSRVSGLPPSAGN